MKQITFLLATFFLMSINLFATNTNVIALDESHCEWKSWFEKPHCGDTYQAGKDLYVRVKAKKSRDIEWMKLYVNGKEIRKEKSAPYEWGKSSGDHELRNMKAGTYKLKVKIKDKCGDYHYKTCQIYVKGHGGGGNGHCEWKAWFEKPYCGKKYKAGENLYVRVKAKKPHHIEWMKLYVNGKEVGKESSAPYEWGKSSSDHELRNMKAGTYKLKVKIKDKCGDYHYEYCEVYFEGHGGGQHCECEWKAWFEKPFCGKTYKAGEDLYVKVKAKNPHDIQWMKLYVNGKEIGKESNAPFVWSKSDYHELRNMKKGTYKLKVKIKDRCGNYHYEYCEVYFEGHGGGQHCECEWKAWFEKPYCGKKYKAGENLYVRVKAKNPHDIQWMKLYVNGKEIGKESSAPYEWSKSEHHELKDMKAGTYKLKVKIKDKCGEYHYEYCEVYFEGDDHCEWDAWFEKPYCGKSYKEGKDIYVKIKAKNPHDIEYMKLYLNGKEIRKESSAPYEWGKSGGSDHELRNMACGTYRLKVKIKDKCGDYHYKECKFYIKH